MFRQVGLGEPHQHERSPLGRVTTVPERHDLQCHVRLADRVHQPLDLRDEHVPAAHRAAQRGLVHDRPQPRRVLFPEHLLPPHPQRDAPLDLLRVEAWRALQHDRPRVILRLQQAGHELNLVLTDELGGFLEPHEDLKPVGHGFLVLLPPGGLVRFARQLDQLLALLGVPHAVVLEQVGDVPLLERHPAELHPAYLGTGGTNVIARVFAGDADRLTEPPKLCTKQDPQNCWAASRGGSPGWAKAQRDPFHAQGWAGAPPLPALSHHLANRCTQRPHAHLALARAMTPE